MYPVLRQQPVFDFRVHRTCCGDRFYSGAIFTTLGLILVFKYAKYIEVYVEEHSNTYDVYMEFENEDKMSMVIKKLREEDIMISNVVIIKRDPKHRVW